MYFRHCKSAVCKIRCSVNMFAMVKSLLFFPTSWLRPYLELSVPPWGCRQGPFQLVCCWFSGTYRSWTTHCQLPCGLDTQELPCRNRPLVHLVANVRFFRERRKRLIMNPISQYYTSGGYFSLTSAGYQIMYPEAWGLIALVISVYLE